jgi:hypothetical protein
LECITLPCIRRDSNPTSDKLLYVLGPKGEDGPPGPEGPAGPSGSSSGLAFATVSTVAGGFYSPDPDELVIVTADTVIDLSSIAAPEEGDIIGIKCIDESGNNVIVEFEGTIDGIDVAGDSSYFLANNECVLLAYDGSGWINISRSLCQRLPSITATGGTYNPSLTDELRTVICDSGVNFQIEAQATVPWRDGTVLRVVCFDGTTEFSITGSGNSLTVPPGRLPESGGAGFLFELHRVGENDWYVFGLLQTGA